MAIASTISAVASANPLVTGLFAGSFAEGVIGLNGKGTGTSDENVALLSNGESVMTAKETKESNAILWGVRKGKYNDAWLRNIESGKMQTVNTTVATPASIVNVDNSELASKIDKLASATQANAEAIERISVQTSVSIDSEGFTKRTKQVLKRQERQNKSRQ